MATTHHTEAQMSTNSTAALGLPLRDYQRDTIKAVAEAYRRGIRRAGVQLPTGTGKTVVFSNVTHGAIDKARRVLILAHRDELLNQAADKLCQVDPALRQHIGFVQGGRDDFLKPIVIASVQTLGRPRRLQRLLDAGVTFDIVIVDEAHHAAAETYDRILVALGGLPEDKADRALPADPAAPLIIGVSATLQRTDGKSLDAFEEVVYHRDIQSMIREGYLCDLRGIQVKLSRFDVASLRVSRGDYVDSEAGEALEDADAPEHVVKAWLRHASERKTIVFTPTIALAQSMADQFQGAGVAAESVSGVDLDTRREILDRFHRGETRVVTNASVLTEGYDEPDVSCVVVARPTRSQILYCQMVGRGTRTALGKTDCLIMDCVSVTERMDLVALPQLLGMDDDVEAEVDDEFADEEADLLIGESFMEREVRLQEQGKIVAKQISLFNRQDLAWTCSEPGVWVLSLRGENVTLEVQPDGLWDVTVYRGRGASTRIATGLNQGLAMGAAEDYARRAPGFVQQFVDKNAAWRGQLATISQAKRLRGLRQAIPACPTCAGTGGERVGRCGACEGSGKRMKDGRVVNCYRCAGDGRNPGDCPSCQGSGTTLTKGEASDLMTQAISAQQRRRAVAR